MPSQQRPKIHTTRTSKAIASGRAYVKCEMKECGTDCERVAAWRCDQEHCVCAVHGATTRSGRRCPICNSTTMKKIQ